MVVEKWTEENKESWSEKVRKSITRYRPDRNDQCVGYLLFCGYVPNDEYDTEELTVSVEPSGELKIVFNEGIRYTGWARNSNISLMKQFVKDELPYYKFDRRTKAMEAESGFTIFFRLKE